MTRLSKPVTRVVIIDGQPVNVTLSYSGVTFRFYRSRKGSAMLLPYPAALVRAAMLHGDAKLAARAGAKKPSKRRKPVRRGAL